MKWITRERIKVDRVACPWLIKKFVDQDAEFVFLPHDTDWKKISDGIVFDVPDCELGHHGEEVWMRFVPKYLQAVGATVFVIGLYDALRTLLGAIYAYPGGVLVDIWGY